MPARCYTALGAAEFLRDATEASGQCAAEGLADITKTPGRVRAAAIAKDFLFPLAGAPWSAHGPVLQHLPTSFAADGNGEAKKEEEAEKEAAQAQAEAEKKEQEKPPRPPKFAEIGPSPPESWSAQMHMDTVTSGVGRAGSRAKDLHEKEEMLFGVVLTFVAALLLFGGIFGEHVVAYMYRRQKARLAAMQAAAAEKQSKEPDKGSKRSGSGSKVGSRSGSAASGGTGRAGGPSASSGDGRGLGMASGARSAGRPIAGRTDSDISR